MKYDAEVKISLKKGILNPEAATIQRALALLKYQIVKIVSARRWMRCVKNCSATR
jgi:phosphoribosylformylglycinamidine synthase PurS subunit